MSVSFRKCSFLSDYEHYKNAGNPHKSRMRRAFRERRIMFEDINKLKYFKKAEAAVSKAGYGGFLIVDRTKFAITGRKNAKIYFLPIPKKGNVKKFEKAINTLGGGAANPRRANRGYKDGGTIRLIGYMYIPLEKRDREKLDW